MAPEARLLALPRAALVVVVETGLADADHLGVAGPGDQGVYRGVGLGGDVVRVHADRAEYAVVSSRDRERAVELAQAGTDRLHDRDPGIAGALDDHVEVVGESGKIEVAVADDQAPEAPSPAST